MAGSRCRTAEKEHRCDECGRLIPIGHKYWRKYVEKGGRVTVDHREHTNCLMYQQHEELHPGFNHNRAQRKP